MRSPHDDDLVHLRLDGRQVVGLLVGSLVTLSAVFALGVTFGRRLADAPAAPPVPADLSALDQLTAPPATFAFGELLAKSEPPPVVPPPSPKPKPAPKPEPKPEPEPTPEPQVVTAMATPAREPEPAPKPEQEPAPADALEEAMKKLADLKTQAEPEPEPEPEPEQPSRRWSVQFGASQDRAEADRLAASLLGKGLTPFVVVADIPGKGTFYRVRVGRYQSKGAADAVLAGARNKGLDGLVMPVQ